ncbi:MAG: hypothetical protein IV100_10450 [Myxococcales bacterium]|nr:hypothetical protein [Myxococcales bacterium]
MTDRFLIAAESEPDARLVSALADRALAAAVPWAADNIDTLREWVGLDGDTWVDVHCIKNVAKAKGIKGHGHFGDEPGQPDAAMARKLFLLANLETPQPSIVVLVRDADQQDERRRGFEQAATEKRWPFRPVLALATPEIEAWVLSALHGNEAYNPVLKPLRSDLGFDPTRHPERLSSTSGNHRDAKSVLASIEPNRETARGGLEDRPLDALRSYGACGLGTFIEHFETACRHVFDPRRGDSVA